MRKMMKTRLAVLLSIVMILPAIVAVLPMAATDVMAAPIYSIDKGYYTEKDDPLQVEKGQKFNIGDYAWVYDGTISGTASSVSKVSYASSKKSVATVSKKGEFVAKKVGSTTITMKYRKKSLKLQVQVVEKGTFANAKGASTLRDAAKKLSKGLPKKVTSGNAFSLIKKVNAYNKVYNENSMYVTSEGFLREEVKMNYGNYVYTSYKTTTKLAVPEAGKAQYARCLLWTYSDKYSPISTRSSKMLKVKSISGNTKQLEVKTTKKATKEHVIATAIDYSSYNEKPSQKSAVFRIYLWDETAKTSVSCEATIKKGSDKIILQRRNFVYVNGELETQKANFEKGHTYVLGDPMSWGGGKKAKVK